MGRETEGFKSLCYILIIMADTGIFATTAEVERKAGANASATSKAEAYVNDYMTQVESQINVATGKNWSDAYSGLNADVKGILKEVASNLAAIYVIQYDMSGYTTRIEAEDMVNILRDAALRGLSILREVVKRDFMTDA